MKEKDGEREGKRERDEIIQIEKIHSKSLRNKFSSSQKDSGYSEWKN